MYTNTKGTFVFVYLCTNLILKKISEWKNILSNRNKFGREFNTGGMIKKLFYQIPDVYL